MPAPLTVALPSPDGVTQTLCARMDGAAIDAVRRVQTPPTSSACRTVTLPYTGPIRVGVLFDVHTAGTGWAFLAPDDFPPPSGCQASLPQGPKGSCATLLVAGWSQVALSCDIGTNEGTRLYIRGTTTSPHQVFAAAQDPHASPPTSVYLLAVQSPLAVNQMEETLFFVSGSTNRLLYEGPLQT